MFFYLETERDFIKKVILEKEIQLIEYRNKILDLRKNGLPEFQILKNNEVEHKVKCINEDQYFRKLWNEQINIREVKRFYEIKLKRIESNKTQSNSNQIFHLLSLTSILDSLKDLEFWPDVKLDIEEILDEVRKMYSESLIESNKRELTKNLYLSEKPNIFYMRELDRVLNLTNASIQRIDLEFKKYPDFIIKKNIRGYTRECTLQSYFQTSVSNFESFYSYAKGRIKEVKELQGKQYDEKKPQQVTTKHPFETTETLELFNYIADNWEYKPDIKWAYIYMFFDNPKIYKNEYERHVKKTKDFEGLFNYNNANSSRVYDALKELKETFIKNYP